ncbi:MAG: hypothetical protein RIR26_793 [Pseudomonadota bacterium]
MRLISGLVFLSGIFALATACGMQSNSALHSTKNQETAEKVGLLFASHGDINDPDTQLEDYIKVSFQKNVGIPLPIWSRRLVEDPAYRLSVKTVRDQYDIIGPTRYYENSVKQIEAVSKELSALIPGAKAYVGFNFASPYIEDTLEEMRKDGVTKIVVMNKGAQFSYASSGENMEDVLKFLKKNPSYDAEVVGVAHYGRDPRFVEVMAKSIRDDIAKAFPNESPNDICILLGSHGLPQWLINTGDSAITQMKQTVVDIRRAMPEYKIYHGFLNDDFFPGAKWVSPTTLAIAPELLKDNCKNVAMDGRLSFTTHHRATLYDLNHVAKGFLVSESEKLVAQGKRGAALNAKLLPNFDDNADHAKFIATITKEALENKGLTIPLKYKGSKAVDVGSIGKPGTLLFGVTHMEEGQAQLWSPEPPK